MEFILIPGKSSDLAERALVRIRSFIEQYAPNADNTFDRFVNTLHKVEILDDAGAVRANLNCYGAGELRSAILYLERIHMRRVYPSAVSATFKMT